MFKESDLTKYLDDLRNIVNIDSKADNIKGLEQVASFFEEKAKKLELNVIRRSYNPERAKVLIITNANEIEELEYLLLAHIDTVFDDGVAKSRPFTIKSNNAYGPGVIDDKAGALLGIYALDKIDNINASKFAFILNTNEEEGSKGSSVIIQEYAKRAKYTLCLEAAREDGSLVDKRYGKIYYKINFEHKDYDNIKNQDFIKESSLLEAAGFMKNLNILNNQFKGSMLNFTLQNIEPIKLNEIHKNITIGLQMMFTNHDSIRSLKEKIELSKQNRLNKTIEIKEEIIAYYPAMELSEGAKELKKVIWKEGRQFGINIKWQSSKGGSDACFASESGSSSIDGLGPVGGNFHKEDEYLDISSVIPRCNLLISIINKINKDKKEEKSKND